jgi:hypothetical protein
LILGQWLEVRRFEIQTTAGQLRTDVLWNQLLVEMRSDGEFWSY